jgi:hypothetical protein
MNKDFVLIELLLDNNSLSIYVEADGLTPKEWARAMQTRASAEIIEGFNSYTAEPIAMSVSQKLCFGVRTSYADTAWVRKYMNVNGKDAEDTTTI